MPHNALVITPWKAVTQHLVKGRRFKKQCMFLFNTERDELSDTVCTCNFINNNKVCGNGSLMPGVIMEKTRPVLI